MKKLLLISFSLILFVGSAKAQTSAELLGKWQMVKWTKNGNEKAVADSTYQIFKDDGHFISFAEGKEHKGKWKLSKDNKTLTIISGLFVIKFSIDYFDAQKRIITNDQAGTWEYKKIEE